MVSSKAPFMSASPKLQMDNKYTPGPGQYVDSLTLFKPKWVKDDSSVQPGYYSVIENGCVK